MLSGPYTSRSVRKRAVRVSRKGHSLRLARRYGNSSGSCGWNSRPSVQPVSRLGGQVARWGELKTRWQWMVENLPDDEPISFPRREARRRAANKEKRHRISFVTDEVTYQEFWQLREEWMREFGDNPTLVNQATIEAMKQFDVAVWKAKQESAGDA